LKHDLYKKKTTLFEPVLTSTQYLNDFIAETAKEEEESPEKPARKPTGDQRES